MDNFDKWLGFQKEIWIENFKNRSDDSNNRNI